MIALGTNLRVYAHRARVAQHQAARRFVSLTGLPVVPALDA